jgi:protein TonB
MVTHLLESGTRQRRSLRGALPSIALHAALIGGAIHATAHAALRRHDVSVAIDTVVFVPPAEPPRPSRVAPRTGARSAPTERSTRIVLTPPTIPVISFTAARPEPVSSSPVSSHDFGRGIDSDPGARASGTDAIGVPGAGEVDVPAAPIGTTTPRYPDTLRASGIEGQVVVQFVVDTAGAVESGSMRILSSTNDLFVSAVRTALRSARFRPAEAGGRKVRQRVEQAFTFVLH